MDYCHLRKEFPETISMDQLYRICHISKRKAHWLLENGIIPCRDSGKHTRRFSIPLEEVIRFLELRDAGVLEEVIPHGAFSGGSSRRSVRPGGSWMKIGYVPTCWSAGRTGPTCSPPGRRQSCVGTA